MYDWSPVSLFGRKKKKATRKNYLICYLPVSFVMIHTNIRWLQSCYQVRTKCQACILLELVWMNINQLRPRQGKIYSCSKNFIYHYASQNTTIRLPPTSHQITTHNSLHVLELSLSIMNDISPKLCIQELPLLLAMLTQNGTVTWQLNLLRPNPEARLAPVTHNADMYLEIQVWLKSVKFASFIMRHSSEPEMPVKTDHNFFSVLRDYSPYASWITPTPRSQGLQMVLTLGEPIA